MALNRRIQSDAERLAKTRILLFSILIYSLCMGFLALGDHLYRDTSYLLYSRLATFPFFLLLLLRWKRLVRVHPPEALTEARDLQKRNRPRAAREKYEELRNVDGPQVRRLNRARRILQGALAVSISREALLESGRCSLQLGELDRAIEELGEASAKLPARAEVAIELAEALSRSGQDERAGQVLAGALPHMDEIDHMTLQQQPALVKLMPAPRAPRRRSPLGTRIFLERMMFWILAAAAAVHGLHLYLGLF